MILCAALFTWFCEPNNVSKGFSHRNWATPRNHYTWQRESYLFSNYPIFLFVSFLSHSPIFLIQFFVCVFLWYRSFFPCWLFRLYLSVLCFNGCPRHGHIHPYHSVLYSPADFKIRFSAFWLWCMWVSLPLCLFYMRFVEILDPLGWNFSTRSEFFSAIVSSNVFSCLNLSLSSSFSALIICIWDNLMHSPGHWGSV